MTHAQLGERLAQLTARLGGGPKLGLEGVRRALELIGRPERELAVVHVAGTNGKGSVCAMVESVAIASGLRTGLFTSPHLCRFNERIRIDGDDVTDDALAEALTIALDPQLPELTFFETLTVAATWLFRELRVELAILEVGLGGRLDATNVVERPLACAVVSVGLDHMELLGTSLAEIALEKAGILKAGCPAVLGDLGPAAREAVLGVAQTIGVSPLLRVCPRDKGEADSEEVFRPPPAETSHEIRYAAAADGSVHLAGAAGRWSGLRPSLRGPHQAHNAAVAAGLVAALAPRWPAMPSHLPEGLAATRWPGRLEAIERDGIRVLIDCAHNPHGVDALVAAVTPELAPERTALLFGAVADKQWESMLERLAPLAARRYYTEPLRPIGTRRSADPHTLATRFFGTVERSPREAIARALREGRRGDTILVAGSVFLAGAVRATLLGLAEHRIVPA